jgi:hypothetical protein
MEPEMIPDINSGTTAAGSNTASGRAAGRQPSSGNGMAARTALTVTRGAAWWQRASWVGLILLGAFNLYAAVADLAGDTGVGVAGDHSGTFTALTGQGWASFKAAQPGAAHYITLVERGYALHELVFAILFLTIAAIPLRAGQRWALLGRHDRLPGLHPHLRHS